MDRKGDFTLAVQLTCGSDAKKEIKKLDLKSLSLKHAYSSDFDDILDDFYIPTLKQSSEYLRLAGFFSSTSLAIAARGILGFIRNGGNMKLIVSARLKKEDLDIILDSSQCLENIIEHRFLQELNQLEEEFVRDHVSALGWMVANGILKIKVAVPNNESGEPLEYQDVEYSGLFHQKVGILRDSLGNTISFSGSVNETASGWLDNIEEFKVFRDWETSEDQYVQADLMKFNRFWINQSWRVRVIDIPHAVEERLINTAPDDIDRIDLDKYYKRMKKRGHIELFHHQRDALDAWLRNDMMGIFSMATGTGKTFAALGCLDKASRVNKKFLVVITCPYQHLVQQWKREISKYGVYYDELIIADSSNVRWKNLLVDTLIDISLGYKDKVIVLTTHSTFSSKKFIEIIQGNKSAIKILLIADEVHGLGAKKSQKGFLSEYDFRLGLSATPRRWFDIAGTKTIYDFFNGEIFQFGLEEAINSINPHTGETYLVPYRYIPKFAYLTIDEMEEYAEKTRRIARLMSKATCEEEKSRYLESLFFTRADIIKNAHHKYIILDKILAEIPSPIKWTIIYSSPQQIDTVMKLINKQRIIAHRFTMEEGTSPRKDYNGLSERDFLLKGFGEGTFQALVAMKCLDEGVDVPPARIAIFMASSGNPREHIQRIGRVLRRYSNKKEAIIFDIIVLPPLDNVPPELREMERIIIRKELQRYEEIARAAINNAEALATVLDTIEALKEQGNERRKNQ